MDSKKVRTIENINIYESIKRGKSYRVEGKIDLAIKQFRSISNHISPQDNPFLFNILLNEIEITQGKTILESKPRGLGIALTNRCNLRCIMCSVWKEPWDMPEKSLKEITALFPYLERILWQGGEVFLSPYFEDLFEEISAYPHIRQDINTNGLLIDKNWAKKLIKANANIIFSIDGITKETYEYIRKGAKFADLIKSIDLINEYAKEEKQDEHYNGKRCSIIINLVVMKSNYRELDGFIDFAKKYGFHRLQITPVDIGNQENIFIYKDIEALRYINKIIPELISKAKTYGISVSNWLPDIDNLISESRENGPLKKREIINYAEENKVTIPVNNRLSCNWPWQFLFIDWGGRVRPQCFCVKPVGNVLENSIEEVWNSNFIQMYRQKLFNNDYKHWCDERCIAGKIPTESLSLDLGCLDGADGYKAFFSKDLNYGKTISK